MDLLKRFGEGLRWARTSRGLTQEDFSTVSSRTYLSSLERGVKAPTITKIEQIASVVGVHPLTLLALAYLQDGHHDGKKLCAQICADLSSLELKTTSSNSREG
jgi:transcriptional regulator with XRE-family HTH domain